MKQSTEDNNDTYFRDVLNKSLKIFFKDAVKTTLRNPLQAYYFIRTVGWQKKAARLRANWEQQGVHVPPIMIFSITDRCNLNCKGCYNKTLRQTPQEEMSAEKLESVMTEAKELGISFVVIGGGEPLVRGGKLSRSRKNSRKSFFSFSPMAC